MVIQDRDKWRFSNVIFKNTTEEVTKVASATWGSADGTLVMYAQYDDGAVSELWFPWLAGGFGGAGAARSGLLLNTMNNTKADIFPDQVTLRYPTVK